MLGADRKRGTTLYSLGATEICRTMANENGKRLLLLSNFGVMDEGRTGWKSSLVIGLIKPMVRGVLEDYRKALAILREQSSEWTAVRPMLLTNWPHFGRYRVSPEELPPNGSRISRSDVADFMLKEAQADRFVRAAPGLAY